MTGSCHSAGHTSCGACALTQQHALHESCFGTICPCKQSAKSSIIDSRPAQSGSKVKIKWKFARRKQFLCVSSLQRIPHHAGHRHARHSATWPRQHSNRQLARQQHCSRAESDSCQHSRSSRQHDCTSHHSGAPGSRIAAAPSW